MGMNCQKVKRKNVLKSFNPLRHLDQVWSPKINWKRSSMVPLHFILRFGKNYFRRRALRNDRASWPKRLRICELLSFWEVSLSLQVEKVVRICVEHRADILRYFEGREAREEDRIFDKDFLVVFAKVFVGAFWALDQHKINEGAKLNWLHRTVRVQSSFFLNS